jgi:phosphopantetheine--protein transferase-like protein
LKRRREWLFGRLAAKDAVRLFLKEQHGLELCPIDIEISADEHGRPIVSGEVVDNVGSRLSISIAHSEGEAVAIAGECGDHLGVGVDVEHVDQNCDGLARIALTESERTLVYRIRSWRRREWLLRIWCAKEAVAKALGRGMAGCPLNLVVKDLEIETGRLAVGLAGKLAHQLSTYAGRHFTAYTGCEGSLVFASSLVN